MRYKVLRGVILRTGAASPGSTVEIGTDLDASLARQLVARGTLAPVGAEPAPPPEPGPDASSRAADELVSREPEPEHREPRRRRGNEEG